ncbi:MAG: choice-of-anchor R domain-containing protein [Phycisphaerales bacterium JB065]
MTRKSGLIGMAIVAGLATGGAANAGFVEIAGNLGPGDSFNVVSGFLVQGPDEVSIGNVDQAVPFSTGAVGVFATTIELGMRLTDGLDEVNISIYSDAGGVPGAALTTTVGTNLPGPNVPELASFTLDMPFLLDANTNYWIVADADADTEIVWHHNDIGMTLKAGRSGDPVGPWNISVDATTPAFRIFGRDVPAPGTVALLAGAGLAGLRRRRG